MGRVIKAQAALAASAAAPAMPVQEQVARLEATALFEAARRDGLAAGHAEGLAQTAALLAAARDQAAQALAAVTPTAIALAGRMAAKIVGHAIAVDDAVLAEIAAEALGTCRVDVASVRVRVHPDHLAALERRRSLLAARLPAAAIELLADPAVSPHGCVIDTPRGRVDARLETQLAALERVLSADEAHRG